MSGGKQIRLFLVNGNAGGLMTAEIINWTGHVLRGSRLLLGEIRQRPEASRTGIYMLFGEDENSGEQLAYIGQSDDVASRLSKHHREKSFWNEVVLITSKDANLTSAHARYLESRLVELATNLDRVQLANSNSPSGGALLPEADASDMDYFIDHIRILMPVLGYDIFRGRNHRALTGASIGAHESSSGSSESLASPVFHLRQGQVDANAQVIDGEFTVLSGSRVKARMADRLDSWAGTTVRSYELMAPKHAQLVENLALEPDGVTVVLDRDHVFKSPSAAAAAVLGTATRNGRAEWVNDRGQSYGVWEDLATSTGRHSA